MRWIAAALCLAALPALAQPPSVPAREVTVANETDRTLQELYLSPAGQDRGPDRLGSNVLPPRATFRVSLGRTRDCAFELRAVFDDGEEMRRRVDACRSPRVTLAEAGRRRDVEVVNEGDLELRELYLSPPGSREEGRDRLGSETVSPGETFRLRLRGEACAFDLRAVFGDDTEERRRRIDICRTPRLTFGDPSLPVREATVSNRGRRTIRELYARAAGTEAWGADRLGAAVLEPRGEFRLRLRQRGCRFDLRAVFDGDRDEVRRDQDLCANQALAFGVRTLADGPRRVTLINAFGRTVQQVYLTPHGGEGWGEDALGNDVLAAGARREFTLEGDCRADLRIVFDTAAAEERRDIDICAVNAISLRPGWTIEERLAPAEGPPPAPAAGSIRLLNRAVLPVVELYADAPGTPRGTDRLGRTVLGAGEALDFTPPEGLGCRADLTAVYRDGRELRLPGTDLCAGAELVLQ